MIRRDLAARPLQALLVGAGLAAMCALAAGWSADAPLGEAAAGTPTSTASAGSAIERVAPAFQSVSLSQSSFSVDVTVENVSALGAYDVLLTFDSAQVNFVSAADGPFLGSTGRSEICPPPVVQPLSGSMRKLHFGCGTVGSTPPPPSGSGVLATITFAPAATGLADLLLEPSLSDTLGNSINAVAYSGQADIQPGPTATPTSTTTPTATSTPCPGGVCPTPTPVQCSSAQVAVEPPVVAGHPGVVLDVPVMTHNICDLGGFQITLGYDASQLTFSQAHEGTFLGSTGRTVQCTSPQALPNAVRFNCVTLAPPPPDGASGEGMLATFSFVPNHTGSTPLTLGEAILVKPNADAILATTSGGTASITECATCTTVTPTATPSPTPTPMATNTTAPTATATSCGGPCPTATPTTTSVIATATATPASPPASVRINPGALSGHPGDAIVVPVWVDNVVNMGGFGFRLSWDPALLSFASAAVGPLLESTGRSSFCDVNTSGGPGTVLYSCSTLGNQLPGASGSGVLAYITLNAAAAGTSSLGLSDVTLVTPPGHPIPVASLQDGTVAIGACSGTCPTATSTPTASATATPGGGGATTVSISATAFGVSPGDTFTVNVRISNATNLGSFQFAFDYNDPLSRFIDFVSVQAGTFLGSTGRPVFCPAPSISAISVNYGCVSSGTSALGPNGSGVLATLTFRANNFGSNTHFGVSAAELTDPLGNDSPRQLGPLGDVESLPAAATSTATATASPTPGSGGGGAAFFAAAETSSNGASASVTPALEGDVNGDCRVDVADMQDIAGRYGATLGTSLYLPSRDLQPAERDGAITIADVQDVLGRVGTRCGDPPVQCPPPGGQPDNDGPDSNFPWIKDGAPGAEGATTGADNCDPDNDNDGCPNVTEPLLSPPRDPMNPWDFADVPAPPLPMPGVRDQAVTIGDALAVLQWIGTMPGGPPNATGRQYDADSNGNGVPDGEEYDRQPEGARLSGPPNGSVSIGDALVVLGQVGAHCN